MTRDVRELLDDAVAQVPRRPGGLDAVRERARSRARRQRAGLVAAVAAVVLLGVLIVVPEIDDATPPLIGPGEEESVDEPIEDGGEEPVRVTQVQHLGDVPVDGSGERRRLEAFLAEDDQLCLVLDSGRVCGDKTQSDPPIDAIYRSSWIGPDSAERCVRGPVYPSVSTVEMIFDDGTADRAVLFRGEGELDGVVVYAACWTGERVVHQVRALDAQGDVLAEVPEDQ